MEGPAIFLSEGGGEVAFTVGLRCSGAFERTDLYEARDSGICLAAMSACVDGLVWHHVPRPWHVRSGDITGSPYTRKERRCALIVEISGNSVHGVSDAASIYFALSSDLFLACSMRSDKKISERQSYRPCAHIEDADEMGSESLAGVLLSLGY